MLRFMTRLCGPVFAKELVEMARRKRYYLNRVLFGLGLLCGLALAWQSANSMYGNGQMPLLQDLADLARELFSFVATTQFIAVFVFVPPLLCGVVASEREAHTLDLLLTTQLSDREIVLGKLGSRLWVVLLLLFSGLPVMNIIMLFGGVDPAAVWRVQAATLLAIIYVAAHSLYFSSATRSPLGALIRTYWWLALWVLGLPVLAIMLAEAFSIRPNSPGSIIVYGVVLLDPLFAFMAAVERGAYQEFSRNMGAWFFPFAFVIPSAWSALLLWRSVVRLRRSPRQYAIVTQLANWWRNQRAAIHRRSRERSESRWMPRWLAGENPLWRRARLSHAYDREGHLRKVQWAGCAVAAFFMFLMLFVEPSTFRRMDPALLLLAALWILIAWSKGVVSIASFVTDGKSASFDAVLKFIGLMQWAGLVLLTLLLLLAKTLLGDSNLNFRRYHEVPAVFLSVTWIVLAVLTAVVSAGSLIGDRRRGFFDMLLTTPMEPREIIDGTLLAVWQHLRLGFFLAWGLTLFFVIFGHTSLLGGLHSITTAMLFGLLLAMLGILCSLTARNVTAALAPTIAFPLLLCIVPPLLTDSLRTDVMLFVRVATLIGLGLGFALICWKINVWTVAIWFTAMHFAFAGLGQIWSDGGHRNNTPIIGMNPAALTVMTLVDELENLVEREHVGRFYYGNPATIDSSDRAILVTLSEWLALIATFFCARWWTIRHFDELVGRRELTGSATWLRSRAKYPAAVPEPVPQVSTSGES